MSQSADNNDGYNQQQYNQQYNQQQNNQQYNQSGGGDDGDDDDGGIGDLIRNNLLEIGGIIVILIGITIFAVPLITGEEIPGTESVVFFADSPQEPTVELSEPTEVTENSAAFEVQQYNASSINTTLLLEWDIVGEGDWEQRELDSSSETINVTIDELEQGTRYTARVILRTNNSQNVSEVIEFETETSTELSSNVVSRIPSDITYNSAVLEGRIVKEPREAIFITGEYKLRDADEWIQTEEQTIDSVSDFSFPLEELEQNTTYQYRYSLTSGNVNMTTTTNEFTTPLRPIVNVENIESVNSTWENATVTGQITEMGLSGETDVYVEYKPNNVDDGDWLESGSISVNNTDAFNLTFEELSPDTTYEYRFVADDGDDVNTSESETVSTTAEPSINITHIEATDISYSEMEVTSEVTNIGVHDSISVTHEYKKIQDEDTNSSNTTNSTNNWTQLETVEKSSVGEVTQNITEIEPNTTYTVRFYAEREEENVTSSEQNYTTQELPPLEFDEMEILESNISSVTVLTDIRDMGIQEELTLQYEYKNSSNETWVSGEEITINETGEVETTIDGLNSGTSYDIRPKLYADNQTTMQENKSFETGLDQVLDILATPPKNVTYNGADFYVDVQEINKYEYADIEFEYMKSGNILSENVDLLENVTESGEYSYRVEGLDAGSDYEYKVIGYPDGVESDNIETETVTFTTDPEPTVAVETGSTNNTQYNSTEISAEVTEMSNIDEANVTLEYRESGDEIWKDVSTTNVSEPTQYSDTITGLSADTEYEYRAVLETRFDEIQDTGQINNVTTAEDFSVEFTASGAVTFGQETTFDGSINFNRFDPSEDNASATIQYRSIENDSFEQIGQTIENPTEGAISQSVSALDAGKYEFKVVGNATTTYNGSEITRTNTSTVKYFTVNTTSSASIEPGTVTNITDSSAQIEASVNSFDGSDIRTYIEYRSLDDDGEFNETPTQTIDSPQNVSFELTELQSDTMYEYRFVGLVDGSTTEISEQSKTFSTDKMYQPYLEITNVSTDSPSFTTEDINVSANITNIGDARFEGDVYLDTNIGTIPQSLTLNASNESTVEFTVSAGEISAGQYEFEVDAGFDTRTVEYIVDEE